MIISTLDCYNGGFWVTQAKNAYLCRMFVRKKRNRSCTISIVAVSKSHGQFKEVKNFGVAQTESEAENLYQTALHWLETHGSQQTQDFENNKGLELEETKRVISNMDAVLINGTQLLLHL